ncbi:MAG: ABC transporter substrate-binding protein [Bacteroidota bacterium]
MKNYWSQPSFFFLLLAAMLLVSSCGWFKPARDSEKEKVYTEDDLGDLQGTKVFDPETGEWRTVREVSQKVDTVRWTELSEKDYPPIMTDGTWSTTGSNSGSPGGPAGGGGQYDVSIILPFLANQSSIGEIDPNSYWAMHYYAGARLAYESLAATGASLNVTVSDSDGSSIKINRLLSENKAKDAELIIGPYKRDNVRLMEPFSKQNNIPLAVPYTAQLGLANGNPNYIQLNPSLASHCEAITKHARAVYDTENITLVAQDLPQEKNRFVFFQKTNSNIEGTSIGAYFREYAVTTDEDNQFEIDMVPYISQGETSVFIIPSWSSESFVYSVLRALMIEQAKGENIVVYGMPMWIDFDQIDYEFYQKLNVHVSSASYIDPTDERVRQFKRKFFDTYGTIPREEAYLGYDAMNYFGRMLHQYGKEFPKSIDREPYDVLHGRFEFERVVLQPEDHREDLDYFDQLENKFVHILQFRDFQFQPAR